ncbi:hypothetical protein AM228_26455 [Planktothricoides sp. SR001]|uniref:DALR anticodon-binding domain-containing protein n=1 Tax=Planktothricoides sp. SR001 TaxID=1705388 RepID=UPI0006C6CC06|nr:DALR anticodon-binding domain-containing protein [Planktothricoides sp. SR001]KOR34018.1 hypothetical protein AM228_26455 [Planktothricoides sp. SR001]
MTKPHLTYLDTLPIRPEQLTSSADLRFTFTGTFKSLLQQTNHTPIAPPKPTPNPETFLKTLKTHSKIYQASMSRQFAADLPPDIEQTTLKDEPKDWFIKTADFRDDCDRVLQHRNGEYTQLLKDLAIYDQILQEHCDKIIVLRPSNYGKYDVLINAAMQCLGYTKEQFQFIIVQPIKLYAFHKPSQKIHPIPDIATDELIKEIGMDALRWHSFRVPLTGVAPINISTAGQPTPADSLYRVQATHARCCALLKRAAQQGIIELDTNDQWQITAIPPSSSENPGDNPHTLTLTHQLQSTPQILEQSAKELAPNLLCQHLETLRETCELWFKSLTLDAENCTLLLKVKQTFFDILQNVLKIQAAELAGVN